MISCAPLNNKMHSMHGLLQPHASRARMYNVYKTSCLCVAPTCNSEVWLQGPGRRTWIAECDHSEMENGETSPASRARSIHNIHNRHTHTHTETHMLRQRHICCESKQHEASVQSVAKGQPRQCSILCCLRMDKSQEAPEAFQFADWAHDTGGEAHPDGRALDNPVQLWLEWLPGHCHVLALF
jgi:hypothetical protein